ncbi:BglG family transcription antiterminator [Enterococcus sp. AZ079]
MMNHERTVSILKKLSQSEYISSEKLSVALGLSSKTVLNEIKEINKKLNVFDASIEMKPKSGCRLVIHNKDLYLKFLTSLQLSPDDGVPSTPDERIRYIIITLLEAKHWIKLEELCEELYISQSSLSKDLKEVRNYFTKYNLKIESKPNYGMRIKGDEFDIRLCLVSIVTDQNAKFFDQDIITREERNNIIIIKSILDQVFEEVDFQITDISYHNLVFHILFSLKRVAEQHYAQISEKQLVLLKRKKEFYISKRIMESVYKEFQFSPKKSEEEIAYIAIHLEAKRTVGIDNLNHNIVITDEINEMVSLMLNEVKDIYYIDFNDDFDLRMMLALHLIPFNVRMKHDLILRNPLLKDIKTQYTFAFNLAVAASDILRKHFNKSIEEEEIAYFALHFNLALERKKSNIEKKSILIVCGTGRGTAQLLLFRFKENFGKYLKNIYTSDVLSVKNQDFSKIDYVVTTVPLDVEIPVPILEIKSLMGETDIKKVQRFLTNSGKSFIEKYFSSDLFFKNIEVSTKEEVIRYMVDEIKKVRSDITDEFYDSIIKRENQATTEFGNLLAIPHPYRAMSNDTFVCVCILKKPITWDKKKVQLIYMTSMETNTDRDLMTFYKVTSKLLVNNNYIREIIQTKSFHFMIELLRSIEENID